jgi:hypothetical protein
MSRCDVSIHFDREDRTYAAGEEIRGEVKLYPHRDVQAEALRIELGWSTHGAGNVDKGMLETQQVDHLHLMANRETTHPFRFTAPTGPLTYHGPLLNVEINVNAQVDVSWAIDPKASEDLILVAGPGSRQAYLGEPPSFLRKGPSAKTGWILFVLLAPLILALVLMLFVLLLILSPFLLGAALFVWARKRLAERRVGKVEVRVDAPEAAEEKAQGVEKMRAYGSRKEAGTRAISPGSDFAVSVYFMPPKAVELAATATLVGEEKCRSGSGSNAVTHKRKVCEQEIVLSERRQVQPGQPVELRATLTPPVDSGCSFESSDNSLTWTLDFRIDIPGPDWVETRKLRMVPGSS